MKTIIDRNQVWLYNTINIIESKLLYNTEGVFGYGAVAALRPGVLLVKNVITILRVW